MDTQFPKTLVEAIHLYSDEDFAHATMVSLRWPNGVTCPHCGATGAKYLEKYRRFECLHKHSRRQFTVKVGTIFEDSPISIGKWLMVIWMLTADKNGVSSYEIHRGIGVTQKTAWFMLHRVRLALKSGSFEKMSGTVEADESHVGGKTSNFKKAKIARLRKEAQEQDPTRRPHLRRVAKKQIVMGMLERGKDGKPSQIRTELIAGYRRQHVQQSVRRNVEPGSELMTDALASYKSLDGEYIHKAINHAVKYAEGLVHTNGVENFWALMTRMLLGTYVAVEPFHLEAYLDEQAFRFNNRKMTDGERFAKALRGVTGRRVMYADLIGKTQVTGIQAEPIPAN